MTRRRVFAIGLSFVGASAMMLLCAGQIPAQTGGQHPFDPIAAVLQHPRCLNCHPRGDTPGNGDMSRPHLMGIVRGADGFGAPGARCTACHRSENNALTFVPGAEGWSLAPRSMGWTGLSKPELCTTLKDQAHNGGLDLDGLVRHMDTDPRVLWGWNPGKGRAAVPISHADFMRLLEQWAKAGGPCPAS